MERSDKKCAGKETVSAETMLRASKEIVVKFIEVGRVTPGNFSECFQEVYTSIKQTVDRK